MSKRTHQWQAAKWIKRKTLAPLDKTLTKISINFKNKNWLICSSLCRIQCGWGKACTVETDRSATADAYLHQEVVKLLVFGFSYLCKFLSLSNSGGGATSTTVIKSRPVSAAIALLVDLSCDGFGFAIWAVGLDLGCNGS